jgi:hypothetical protein
MLAMLAHAVGTALFIASPGHCPAALASTWPAYRGAVVDDNELVMLRAGDLDELLEDVRRQERQRAVSIVLEEGGEIAGELCGIICAEISEDG